MRVTPRYFETHQEAASYDLLDEMIDEQVIVGKMLHALTTKERKLIRLRFGIGLKAKIKKKNGLMPYKLLSLKLGKSPNALRQKCRRILSKLREKYKELD